MTWIYANLLDVGDCVSNKTIISILEDTPEVVFDMYEVEDVHCYISNGVISHNCNMLYIDETAFIANTVAEEFFTSVYPTISSGTTSKILLSSTPLGYNHFWKFWTDAEKGANDFVPLFIPYWEIPGRDEAWAEEQRRQLGELKYCQEVLCVAGNTIITLQDTETGKIINIPIEEAYNLINASHDAANIY